jgi:hypothetical protein
MPLYWLCYQHDNQISVVIEPGASLIHARRRAALSSAECDSANINIENHLSITSTGIKRLNYKSILSLEVLP